MKILKENKLIDFDGKLFIDEGKISFNQGQEVKINTKVKYIVPGFIDMHIHGAAGCDVMDNSIESLKKMSSALVKEGTTSFLATTMTYDKDVVKQVISKCIDVNVEGAKILGVHVEGPFINEKFKGAQNGEYILKPNAKDLEYMDPNRFARAVTYAAELDDNYNLLNYLNENNIVSSVGHSGATAKQCNLAIENGLKSFTHFSNASTAHHHREPGVVTSGLTNKSTNVELIVDGIHVHPDAIKMIYNVKGFENITLITDSMSAKSMPDGNYELGGQKVIKKAMEARLENGVLAGSVLEMNIAIKNMIEFSGCSHEEAFIMASYNPAKLCSLSNVGKISQGYNFDVVMLDENFNIINTYVNGNLKYGGTNES